MAMDFVWGDGERVMFLGDSITDDPDGYSRIVPNIVTARYPQLGITYKHRGVSGNRIGDLFDRLDRDVLGNDPPPTWLTISIGINDVAHGASGTPLGRFKELYHALLLKLIETKAHIACFTTTVIGEDLENEQNQLLSGYNDAIRELAFTHQVELVDMNAAFQKAIQRAQSRDPEFRFTEDGIHMNPYGRYLMTNVLLSALHFAL